MGTASIQVFSMGNSWSILYNFAIVVVSKDEFHGIPRVVFYDEDKAPPRRLPCEDCGSGGVFLLQKI